LALSVTVVGSGTLIPDDDRRSPCHVVEAPGVRMLLDCGSGALHGMDRCGIGWNGVSHIGLTHFHVDHLGDLGPFIFALKHGVHPPREAPLTIIGPPGLKTLLDALSTAFAGCVLDPGFPVRVVEVAREGEWRDTEERFRLRTCPTRHTEHSVAYRWESDWGVIAYTGDTGPDPELARFLDRPDVLLVECSHPDPPRYDNHLTPSGVARLARLARPGVTIATHMYPDLVPERVPDLIRGAGYKGTVLAGWDGLRVEVEDGRTRISNRSG
jgi:ribonuclease BN (tRNA processing enzyme)